ncbi:hypothetical protein [Pedosphaera parvula]|uniref:Uncharacterized protein n=1 Tax=Pedosphaera parvula (strain Ellin514) TaxID=320771 RepID=B9XNW3_PEDPL|nr:hypothetical protein [Pedosphaera parvula]EEF58429.1 hypothetical protein Cflav_PD1052 [Pedosphaera parvula Ellin514]
MKTNDRTELPKQDFIIRVHLTDGSVESFTADKAQGHKIWESTEPARLFASPRLVLAGENSKSVFVSAQVLRVDFLQKTHDCWQFPGGYADIVELSEAEFKKHVHLDQPELMAKREQPTPVGDLLVSFLKLRMVGGKALFLMVEFPVKLSAESQSFMQFMLSKTTVHMRLRGGGVGVVNLANLAAYTVYPGVAQIPADAWLVEPVLSSSDRNPGTPL